MNENSWSYSQIIIITFFIFGFSIHNDFVFDDHEALVKNRDLHITNGQTIFSIDLFKHDFWGNDIVANSSHKSYRPLTVIAYRFIAKLSTLLSSKATSKSKLDPFYFHVFNIVSYCFLCCYLYYTLNHFFSCPIIELSIEEFRAVSLKASILFAIHPLHCEPVSSCVGLADILSASCSLVSLNCFVNNIDLYFNKKVTNFLNFLLKSTVINFQILFFITISMLFKEQGITLLGFLILLIVQLIWKYPRDVKCFQLLFTATIFLSTIIALFYLRLWIMNFKVPIFSKMDNPSSHIESFLFRYINYSYIYLLNTFIMICPIWLSFDWSMGCVPIIQSFGDFRFIFVTVFWIAFLIFISKILLLNDQTFRDTIMIFSMFSIITFLPASNLFFQVGFVIAERNLFLPVLGYIVIFVISHNHFLKLFPTHRKILNYAMNMLLISFALRSLQRTFDWNDELKLFEKDALVCPGNAKIFYNIGKVSADLGDRIKAIKYYRKSLSLYENYTNAMNNLANILKDDHQLIEAKTLLYKACSLDPEFVTGWMNLATLEMLLNNYEKSELYFLKALDLKPDHASTHFNLGNLYIKQNKFKEAENSFKTATKLDEKFTKAWHNLILLKQNLNKTNEAYLIATEALKLFSQDDSLHFLMANILGQQKEKFSIAEYHFKEAIRLNPNNALYSNNLAVLYHRENMYSLAIRYYQETLRLNPDHQNARNNLKNLLLKNSNNKN